MSDKNYDYLIIGAGIIGLSIAREIRQRTPSASICILEKEDDVAFHASSRNSGVMHAGFYYTADSLKARFTVEGNRAMKEYCRAKGLPLNESGKLVVATNEEERQQLQELKYRGDRNGSRVTIIDENQARDLEPNIKTYKQALYSPDTASINPKAVCLAIKQDLIDVGVDFVFDAKYLKAQEGVLETTQGSFEANKIINCAGLYADKIAHDFGFGHKYTLLPFKGLYLKYTLNKTDVKMNIYPVPNLKNPFLGVHFTKTVDDEIKIGPTAIPAFWRENYDGWQRFNLQEMQEVMFWESKLFITNAFNFRHLAFEEMNKYIKSHFVELAAGMVQEIDPTGFTEWTKPGIRAQLLDKKSLALVQDFVVEADQSSVHILNAVSPAFTCAFPFAEYVVETYI